MSCEELGPSQDVKQLGTFVPPAAEGGQGAGGSNVATVLPLPRAKLLFV